MSEPKKATSEAPAGAPTQARARREVLWLLGCIGIGASALEAVWSTFRFARAPVSYGPPLRWVLGTLDAFAPGLRTFVQTARVFVTRDDEGVQAMTAVCTHLGCTVREDKVGFVCPCHGSRYDDAGKVVSGPAPAALGFFELATDRKGRLVVDLGRPVDAKKKLPVR